MTPEQKPRGKPIPGAPPTLEQFFDGHPDSRQIFDSLSEAIEQIGAAEVRVSRSQVAFHRSRAFAWAWIPEMHLGRKAAPLVLSLAFDRHDPSPRWKQVVEPAPRRFMHHLELHSAQDLDDRVLGWLREAWEKAT